MRRKERLLSRELKVEIDEILEEIVVREACRCIEEVTGNQGS
jgi:hypothetical protein